MIKTNRFITLDTFIENLFKLISTREGLLKKRVMNLSYNNAMVDERLSLSYHVKMIRTIRMIRMI